MGYGYTFSNKASIKKNKDIKYVDKYIYTDIDIDIIYVPNNSENTIY